jgi:hypothetical protein
LLKHHWPYKSREPTAYEAREGTSTNNESLKDAQVLIVHLQIYIAESWQPPEDFEVALMQLPHGDG